MSANTNVLSLVPGLQGNAVAGAWVQILPNHCKRYLEPTVVHQWKTQQGAMLDRLSKE